MKKIFLSMLAITMAAFTFTSCEDVPEPYGIPGEEIGGGDVTGTEEPTGDGTQANPFNAAAITNLVSAMPVDVESTEDYYIKGVVVSIEENFTTQYGNAAFRIADSETGKTQFYIFRALYLGNKKYTSGELLKVGDKVVVCGKVVNYKGNKSNATPETVANKAYLVSINDNTSSEGGGGDDQPTDGTYINETFANSFGSFTVNTVKGTPWTIDSYGYAKATGFVAQGQPATPSASYIVSKAVNMTSAKEAKVSFDYILRYVTNYDEPIAGIENKVLVTSNYTGDPTTTQWTDITGTLTEVRDWKTWTKFTADVPADIMGKNNVVFALYYACEESSGTWEVKNFTVKEGKEEGGDTPGGDTGDVNATNGDFETWVNGLPNNWKTASTAGNATLSQSTDAHGGSYSVKVGGVSGTNKRIGYKEMTLVPGDYTMSFYVKAATSTGASARPGYVQVTDGKVGSYMYGDYTNNISNTEWTKITHNFTIASEGTYCLVIMNSGKPGGDLLIDDFTLTMGNTVIIK